MKHVHEHMEGKAKIKEAFWNNGMAEDRTRLLFEFGFGAQEKRRRFSTQTLSALHAWIS